MKAQGIAGVGFMLLATALPLGAQAPAAPLDAQQAEKQRQEADKQRREAEAQLRKAEQQMREAEQAMREAARKLADSSVKMNMGRLERKVVVFSDHARLGVVLRQEKNPATDPIGAAIEALTPGSPAEEAGLRPGDIITKFNGRSLTTGEVDSDEDESAPTARLMDLAGSLKDGDVVKLEYRRGGATATATLTARRPVGPHVRMVMVPHGPGMNEGASVDVPDIPDMPDIDIDLGSMAGRPWRDVDLVALNPELGAYFGSSDGVLVVRAPKEDSLKLQSGDVILKIGDRTPDTPSQAMRILRSYEPGETLTLQVLRKHEKLALAVQVPERRHRDCGARTATRGPGAAGSSGSSGSSGTSGRAAPRPASSRTLIPIGRPS